jgi:hypothetical protein
MPPADISSKFSVGVALSNCFPLCCFRCFHILNPSPRASQSTVHSADMTTPTLLAVLSPEPDFPFTMAVLVGGVVDVDVSGPVQT